MVLAKLITAAAVPANSFTTVVPTYDVSGIATLTVQANLLGTGGAPSDVNVFVKAVPDDGSSPANLPQVRVNAGDTISGGFAAVAQYDVRGIRRVSIGVRNANATNAGTADVFVYGNTRYAND